MIKSENIQINSNISAKTFLILILFSLILLFLFGRSAIKSIIKANSYTKVSATITDVGYHRTHNRGNSKYNSYIKFDYEYNGNNYTNEQRVAFRSNKKVGNKVFIYVNPNNPNEFLDTYSKNLCLIASVFCLILTIFLINAYRIRKNM